MNKQSGMCSFWMMEKIALFVSVCVCVFVSVCVCVLSAILWCHMSCPMLWVLPLSCNNTPQCCLKYSWPGKPITLSQSHGFLIITSTHPPPAPLQPPGHSIPPAFLAASRSPLSFWLHFSHSHPAPRLELKMPLSLSLLNFDPPGFQAGLAGISEDVRVSNQCFMFFCQSFNLKVETCEETRCVCLLRVSHPLRSLTDYCWATHRLQKPSSSLL